MSKLRVDVDSLTSVTIPAMKQEKTNLDTCYDDMCGIVQSLVDNGYMESEAATAYVEEFKTLLAPDVAKLSEMVDTYCVQLGQICTAFSEQDRAIADSLR